MDNVIFVKKYHLDDSELLATVNTREVLRYAGFMGELNVDNESMLSIMNEAINEAFDSFTYNVCYIRYPISWTDDKAKLLFDTESVKLFNCLKGSKEVIMFAATVGHDIDRLIARNQRMNMTKTLFLQAFGAERVEALCDTFCADIKKEVINEGLSLTPRFSPGYGDLPLDVQKDFFNLLDCNRKIGVSLNESLLMSPSKSVTAIFGLKDKNSICEADIELEGKDKCLNCTNTECEYRSDKRVLA